MHELVLFRDRVKNKIRSLFYHRFLYRYDFGNRVSKSTWDKQFANGDWNYLTTIAEQDHYLAIVNMYQKHATGKSILDVGCGKGVLFNYLVNNCAKFEYLGIDISSSAIAAAAKEFPAVDFKVLDFDKQKLHATFDVIIFNETLYYFNRPLKKIQSCIRHNLNKNGFLIISMCGYFGHDKIWERLEANYQVIEKQDLRNELGQKWTVMLIQV